MFRLSSSTAVMWRLRPLAASMRSKSSSSSPSSPSLKQKALKAMLNSANPTNVNGADVVNKSTKEATKLSSPPAFVLEPKKEETSVPKEQESIEQPNTPKLSKQPEILSPQQQQQSQPQSPPLPSFFNSPALHEFAPKIVVVGVGGAGNNAINNMIAKELHGVDFLALNTDAQHLSTALTDQRLQMGVELTRGLGAGANPDAGRMAAEESRDQIRERLDGTHMVFITSGMGGGTGTGASPVVAEICQELGILTVGVVTMPFTFEGTHRRRLALEGLDRLETVVDTLITIPNQNLFRLAGPKTTFVDAFRMADDVLLGGVKSITDLMTAPGLINLDFADVQAVMVGMGNALLGTGVSSSKVTNGDDDDEECDRAVEAAKLALDNPLLGSEWDIATAKGMLVNITGGPDMTLFEVDRAAQCVTEQVKDASANIIFGSAFDERLEGSIRVSVVATGIESHDSVAAAAAANPEPVKASRSRFF
ncbi:protein FtsZ [Seminavis robusta]|uniref:Protein FtsZ n=1 Tax=Seminavis robusta TaxID=568900 RepID=A0A9N8EME8_9STRA|nr:protein FtsZ [Seminavis robusta]|eukprot:Sro1409_g270150.1 protein FtsZ (479) ;mRNA; f:6143-7753